VQRIARLAEVERRKSQLLGPEAAFAGDLKAPRELHRSSSGGNGNIFDYARAEFTCIGLSEGTLRAKIEGTQAALLHRFAAWLIGGFATVALVLGVVGL
jgi:hypothetical protein